MKWKTILLACFWWTVCYPNTQALCGLAPEISKQVRTAWTRTQQTVGETAQWSGGQLLVTQTFPNITPSLKLGKVPRGRPPEGDRSMLCCPELQYVAAVFPGNPLGNWGGTITVEGLWYEELKCCWEGGDQLGWCRRRHRANGRLPCNFQSTNIQEPFKGSKDSAGV